MAHILITGGAGGLGRALTGRLIQAGNTVRLMSRRPPPATVAPGIEWAQVDLEQGHGLADALQGVDAIVHAASSPFRHTRQIDVEGTQRLVTQADQIGVRHLVYISIVGIDRIPLGYYQQKLAAEAVITSGHTPWTILRATQFHELLDQALQSLLHFPVALLPMNFQFQVVDAGEVAARLATCVAAGPAGRVPDMGGPKVWRMGDLAQTWLAARNMRRLILPLYLPGKIATAFRNGHNTCPEQRQGNVTWETWLRQKYQ